MPVQRALIPAAASQEARPTGRQRPQVRWREWSLALWAKFPSAIKG